MGIKTFLLFLIILCCHSRSAFATTTDYTLKKIQTPSYHSTNIFANKINQILPEPSASLLNGILFGIQSSMPKDFYNALKTTGTLHIIALSGYNISIILSAVFVMATPFFGRRLSIIIAGLSIVAFIGFVGPSPSVIRAAIMGILSLISLFFGRPKASFYLLMLTGLIMVVVNHTIISNLSFQLSFFATLGIILFASGKQKKYSLPFERSPAAARGKLRTHKNNIQSVLADSLKDELKITLSAQIFTIPFILYNFGTLSIISPLTNVLIAWTIPIITYLGYLGATLLIIIPILGKLIVYICYSFLSYFIFIVKLTSQLPFAQVNFDKLNPIFYFLYALTIAIVLLLKHLSSRYRFVFGQTSRLCTESREGRESQKIDQLYAQKVENKNKVTLKISKNLSFLFFIFIFSFLFFLFYFVKIILTPQKPRIIFCNVGQGDAILIVTAQNHKILIDGGPDNRVLDCLFRQLRFYDRKIDLTILSHPEKDHYFGLINVIERFSLIYFLAQNDVDITKGVILSPPQADEGSSEAFSPVISTPIKSGGEKSPSNSGFDPDLAALISAVANKKPNIINPKAGDKIVIDDLTLTFLWPEKVVGDKNVWKGSNVILASEARPESVFDSGVPPQNAGVPRMTTTNTEVISDTTQQSDILYSAPDPNDTAIAFLVQKGNFDALFTADLPGYILDSITPKLTSLITDSQLEVLKVSHHGSKTGLSTTLLYQLRPKTSVISVGKNTFGHPNQEILEALTKINSQILRTDTIGDIEIPLE